jgi:hypothetical protein
MPSRQRPTPPPSVVLDQADGWLRAALFQGERLWERLERQKALPWQRASFTPEQQAFHETNFLGIHLVESYEGYFLVCAVRQLLRWLAMLKVNEPSLATAIHAFEDATPHAVDLRDMLEHEDEYLANAGKKPQRYHFPDPHFGGIAASSIKVTGTDDYLIGGRFSVPATLAALRTLLPHVTKAADAARP